jgi:hypothetical protein
MSCVKLCGSGVLASRGPALAGVPVFGVVPVAGFGRLSPNRKLGLVSCRGGRGDLLAWEVSAASRSVSKEQ